jgi:hypothetical protein
VSASELDRDAKVRITHRGRCLSRRTEKGRWAPAPVSGMGEWRGFHAVSGQERRLGLIMEALRQILLACKARGPLSIWGVWRRLAAQHPGLCALHCELCDRDHSDRRLSAVFCECGGTMANIRTYDGWWDTSLTDRRNERALLSAFVAAIGVWAAAFLLAII